MTELRVDSGDVIRLIGQFFKENNMMNSLATLQNETQVSLNSVESLESFSVDVKNGNWEIVLQNVSSLKLPVDKVVDLYEHIFLEMIDIAEIDLARVLLNQTAAMDMLKEEDHDRWARLDSFLTRTNIGDKELFGTSGKEKKRLKLASALEKELNVVPQSRLLTLLGQSLKYQQLQGYLPASGEYDLFRGQAPEISQDETFPKVCEKTIKFGAESHPEVAKFSRDGQSLITGSVDGFIEVWDFISGKLKPLEYQENNKFMSHASAILCMDFSRDGECMVTGCQDGKIKVWEIRTGRCLRKFNSAHSGGVTSVSFSKDGFKILSGSFDKTVRIHGLKSGKTIKIFRGHTSFVNSALWMRRSSRIISASSDGTVRIWDSKTTDCVSEFTPGHMSASIAINSIIAIPNNNDHILLCNKSNTIYIVNFEGQVMNSFTNGKRKGGDFIQCIISPKGEWIYAIAEDKALYCFSVQENLLSSTLELHDREVIGIHHHPHQNIIVTYSDEGELKLWKP